MIGLAVIVGIAIGSPDMLFSRLSIYGFITGFSISSYSMIINDVYDIEIDKDLFAIFIREGVYKEYADIYLGADQIDKVDEASLLG